MMTKDDVFFPEEACVAKLREVFSNFTEAHVLKNCRHIPSHHKFSEIAQKLDAWYK